MRTAAIATDRLRLRPCAGADCELLLAQWNDPDVRRFLWDDVAVPRERVAEAIEASQASFASEGFGLWVVEEAASGRGLGFAGLRHDEDGEVELLYALVPSSWGMGYATEAAGAVVRYGREVLGIKRVVGTVDHGNDASVRVLERLGMSLMRRTDRDSTYVTTDV